MTPEEELVLRDHLESGQHMPSIMRDFHDAKDLFKAIGDRDVSPHSFIKDEINWRQGMIYTIDHFLWFMAIHGYELMQVEGNIPRKDLSEAIEKAKEERNQAFRKELEQRDDANRRPGGTATAD